MPKVKFERKHHDGLTHSAVYVAGNRLEFTGDEAEISLEKGEIVDVYWRIAGASKAKFSLKATVGSNTHKIVHKYEIPKRRQRKSEFAFFEVE